jgi:hypothetical protein
MEDIGHRFLIRGTLPRRNLIRLKTQHRVGLLAYKIGADVEIFSNNSDFKGWRTDP